MSLQEPPPDYITATAGTDESNTFFVECLVCSNIAMSRLPSATCREMKYESIEELRVT